MVFKKHNEHQAQLLSSNKIYEGLIDNDDIFERILEIFNFSFIYDEVEHLYCEDNGRPPEDPVRLYKSTLVQRLKGLSDPEMEYVARYDIRIKHFLGIPIQDYGFDYSTLSLFRKRLGPELFERIFQKIIAQIVELGIIKNPKQQFLDSMPVLAHAALPSVTCLIYQGINGVVKRLDKELKKQVYEETELTDDKLLHYSKAHPLFRMEKAERESAFEKAVNRAKGIIGFLEPLNHKSEELDLLKQILNENVDAKNSLIQTEKPIKTLVDKEAKLGHKTKENLIFGYKNHASVTEEGIVTAVTVTSAADKDDKQTGTIITKQEKVNLKPVEMDADSAYGYIETFKSAKSRGVKLNALFRGLDEKELSIYELKYDKENNTLTCLNNISVKGYGKNNLRFEFPIRKCRDCPRKNRCPLSASKRVELHEDHEIAREAINNQRQKSEERKIAKEKGVKTKSRLIIENVFAYLEKLGGKKTPYIGLGNASIHVLLVVTMSNIMKTVRLLG
ncbi:MAG: transposase [Nanoarchaeota archaeon]|nr:transposase [Nanoarchaeota archaeon]MBU1005058.1 transposase [Nanoarchaeota archaeon]MBU1945706.1 transposase [Nanoarchaeota archaeon]